MVNVPLSRTCNKYRVRLFGKQGINKVNGINGAQPSFPLWGKSKRRKRGCTSRDVRRATVTLCLQQRASSHQHGITSQPKFNLWLAKKAARSTEDAELRGANEFSELSVETTINLISGKHALGWHAMPQGTDRHVKTDLHISQPLPDPSYIFVPYWKRNRCLRSLMQVNFGSFECCSEMMSYCGVLADSVVFFTHHLNAAIPGR